MVFVDVKKRISVGFGESFSTADPSKWEKFCKIYIFSGMHGHK
jgi:hypothetical protein